MVSTNMNKEGFELLRCSSDNHTDSDVSEIIFPVKKKRFRRRLKNDSKTQIKESKHQCYCKTRSIILTLFSSILICWLLTLTWLTVVLHNELNHLTSQVSEVVAGIQGVPDAMQKCHTFSKDLQKNQTRILNRLNGFSLQLSNFSLEMTEVKLGLQTVQNQVKSSPDLVNNPRLIKYLSDSVASFGSQIRDLNSTVTTLKDHGGKVDAVIGELVSNVTKININLTELSKADLGKTTLAGQTLSLEKEAILAIVTQVSQNVSVVNDTLSSKLLWTSEDQSKDHKLIESLQEMNENITTRVKTLEGLCSKQLEPKFFSDNLSGQIVPNTSSNLHTMQQNIMSPSSKEFPTSVEESVSVGSKIKNITVKK